MSVGAASTLMAEHKGLHAVFPALATAYLAAVDPPRSLTACEVVGIRTGVDASSSASASAGASASSSSSSSAAAAPSGPTKTDAATASGLTRGLTVIARIDFTAEGTTSNPLPKQTVDYAFDVFPIAASAGKAGAGAGGDGKNTVGAGGGAGGGWRIAAHRVDLTALTHPCAVCNTPTAVVPHGYNASAAVAAREVDVFGVLGLDFAFHRKRAACHPHDFAVEQAPQQSGPHKSARICTRCAFRPDEVRCANHPLVPFPFGGDEE